MSEIEDFLRAMEMRRQSPDEPDEKAKEVAHATWVLYVALKEEGFTEEQALKLTCAIAS